MVDRLDKEEVLPADSLELSGRFISPKPEHSGGGGAGKGSGCGNSGGGSSSNTAQYYCDLLHAARQHPTSSSTSLNSVRSPGHLSERAAAAASSDSHRMNPSDLRLHREVI